MSALMCSAESRTDEILLECARVGDRDAFGELVFRHNATCLNLATSILRDRSEAQDEVQKAYWQAFRHLDQYHDGRFQSRQGFLAWLLRIVKNQCLMLIRVKRRMPFVYIDSSTCREGQRTLELSAKTVNAEQGLMNREMLEVLHKEIHRIPPLLRTVLVLCDVEEKPMLDVAEQLQISVPAAKSRLLRARRELKARVIVYGSNKEQRGPAASRPNHMITRVASEPR